MWDIGRLCASLVWGSVGTGLFIYGKKQSALLHLVCGALLVVVSYAIHSPLYMSLASMALIAATYFLHRSGS